MNRSFIASVLGLALAAGAWAGSGSANFSGTWALDKARSKGLPMQWQNIESYTLVITQDDKVLTVNNQFEGAGFNRDRNRDAAGGSRDRREPAAGGQTGGQREGGGSGRGQGRARGGRGFGMGIPNASYPLDGTEATIESTGGRGGPVKIKAHWTDGGKVLELTNTRTFNMQGNEMTRTTRQRMELAEGGKVLKVKLTVEGPQGSEESTLLFNKQ